MQIFFDTALDSRIWPHWSSDKNGIVGSTRVGTLGMLGILETLLGLTSPVIPDPIRTANIVPLLADTPNSFWAKSAQADPFGVAKKLLQMRDTLWLHGWRNQPLTPRLSDLAPLSEQIFPGLPDRLSAVSMGLNDYQGDLPEITTLESLADLIPAWREIFSQIAQKGGTVSEQDISPAQAAGDLNQAKGNEFTPAFDGSLQLIQPEGKLQAAEDIAAWLAAITEDDGFVQTVIIGGDAILDNALKRYGLPTIGAIASRYNSSLLQLLPLVIAMGWAPPDPARILELLSLPANPVPPAIGRLLMRALQSWPALGSDDWQEAINNGLTAIDDEKQRANVQKRLEVLFRADAHNGFYPVTAISSRIEMLSVWLRGRFRDDDSATCALNQCQTFLAMVEAMQLAEISEPLLWNLLNEATASNQTTSCQSQAGFGSVESPEAVIGPAKRVVWWSFSSDTVAAVDKTLFYAQERQALEEAEIFLSDPAKQALHRASRWRRPLLQATEQLILVCPKSDESGEELHPHPLWDELLAASQNEVEKLISPLPKTKYSIAVTTPNLTPLPKPEEHWRVEPGSVVSREFESPSSLDTFLGCPLKWTLNYLARLRGGTTATLPNIITVLGSMGHEIIEQILLENPLPAPDTGAKLAGQLFEDKGPLLVAAIFQKGNEVEREKAKNSLIMATRSLLMHLHDSGCTRLEIEKNLTGTVGAQKFAGRADVVLHDPFTVLDLKRSWAKGLRNKINTGTALQLVVYAWMLKEERSVYPELAYFTLEEQAFMTTDTKNFPHADIVKAPETNDVWQAIENSYKEAWHLLDHGVVNCPGNGDEVKSLFEEEKLVMESPCRFCDFDVLCGKRFAGVSI